MESFLQRSKTKQLELAQHHFRLSSHEITIRTAGLSSVVSDGSPLAVELVVNGPGEVLAAAASAVGPTLDGRADGGTAQLLGSPLGESQHVALREHCGGVVDEDCLTESVRQ